MPKEKISEKELKKGLSTIIKDGISTQAMTTLTSGVFLTAFALSLGASNTVIGFLASIPPLSQLIQIPAIFIVSKIKLRKLICVIASFISRIFLLIIAISPLLFSENSIKIKILIISLFFHAIFASVSVTSWNSWMHDLIPHEILGKFFSKRLIYTTWTGLTLGILGALFIDKFHNYPILFTAGFLFGILGIYFISQIPEPKMTIINTHFTKLLVMPFKDENFKNLLIFLAMWNFSVNLSAPFFTVDLLKRLHLKILLIMELAILSQLFSILFLKIWGVISDKFSNKAVLKISTPLFIISIFLWILTTNPEKYFLTIPLLILIHIFMGISTAGVTLATGNIVLKLAPKGEGISYLAICGILNSLSAALGSILGGKLSDYFKGIELALALKYNYITGKVLMSLISIREYDFLFILSFLFGILSIIRLKTIKEEKEIKKRIIINEIITQLIRPMRNFSTAGGLNYMGNFLLASLRIFRKRIKVDKNSQL